MTTPQVTITLGRSGQKVVKRLCDISDASCNDTSALSGSKRSWAQDSSSYSNKRLHMDIIERSSGYSGSRDIRIGGNDLRLKLLHKRISRRIEERKRMEIRQNMSRITPYSEGRERILLPVRRVGEPLQMESSSYRSYTMNGLRPKSPKTVAPGSVGTSSSRPIGQALQLPSPMPIFASRRHMVCADVLHPSDPKGPTPVMAMTASTRTSLYKPLREFPPASRSMWRSIYQDENLTVSSLLHSLGLGKYTILFQAEEVDMAALKQMGDRDLKELGIPMGPRKKIMLAMLAQSKRVVSSATSIRN